VELADVERSVVVVIDLQGKLMEMVERPRLVIEANQRLMKLAELFGVPVILTEQYPKGLGPTHPEVLEAYDALTVPKRRLEKVSFGCCGDAGFEAALGELRPGLEASALQMIVGGIEAHVCVMQTVLEALRREHQVQVLWECTSGRGEEYRHWALERMRQAGAQISNQESVGFEWARDKDHARFKAMSALFKEGQLAG